MSASRTHILGATLIVFLALGLCSNAHGGVISSTNFEGFTSGVSVNGQGGWSSTGGWDESVTSFNGGTVWRVSNQKSAGSFGDMPFAPRPGGLPTMGNPTPNPSFFAGESSTGAAFDSFSASFDVRSATGAAQAGEPRITISPDNGQGGRQGFLAISDDGAGLRIETFDVDNGGNFIGPITIADGLSYTDFHNIRIEIQFQDGEDNDIVNYYVNNSLVHSNGSWEQFYRNFQAAQHPDGVPVQTLLFRLSSAPAGNVDGGGFYIDNVEISADLQVVPEPSSLILFTTLAIGGAGYFGLRRRRLPAARA